MSAETRYATCPLCEATCGIAVDVEGGRVTRVRGDKDDVRSQGYICPKGVALPELQHDPDWLTQPMHKQPDGSFKPVSWDKAYRIAGAGLAAIRKKHGRDAVGLYTGNPIGHSYSGQLYLLALVELLGTKHRFSAVSTDTLPHMLAAREMLGHFALLPTVDIDHCDYFVCLGGNPAASNGSVMVAPNVQQRIKDLARRGQFVHIDPRRNETSRLASQHLFVHPGRDLYLLRAVLTLVMQYPARYGHLEELVRGSEALASIASTDLKADADRCGIKLSEIRKLAEGLYQQERAALYGRMGAAASKHGALNLWLIQVINLWCGNMDRTGGVMFAEPALDLHGMTSMIGMTGSFRKRSTVRGLPEFTDEFPAVAMPDLIENGSVKAMVIVSGNPVLSVPDGRAIDAAFETLDFAVALDPYINETSRHADLILPPAPPLTRAHFDLVMSAVFTRKVVKFAEPVLPRAADQRHDWENIHALCKALVRHSSLRGRMLHKWLPRLHPERLLALGLRLGPYGQRSQHKLTLTELRKHPHGLDFGPLTSRLPAALPRAHKYIAIAPEIYLQELASIQDPAAPAAGALRLIGRRHIRDNNSWMHNVPSLVRGKSRCTLHMHPQDAARLQLLDGKEVYLQGPGASVNVVLQVTDTIMPGTVSLPHGYGHHRAGTQQSTARAHAGVSMNDVLDRHCVDPFSGMAILNGVPVQVTPSPSA